MEEAPARLRRADSGESAAASACVAARRSVIPGLTRINADARAFGYLDRAAPFRRRPTHERSDPDMTTRRAFIQILPLAGAAALCANAAWAAGAPPVDPK